MKYLVICFHPMYGTSLEFETDNKDEAIRYCNQCNRECAESRYTIYEEAMI